MPLIRTLSWRDLPPPVLDALREAAARALRQAFSQAFRLGWVRDESFRSGLMDARSSAVHTYSEAMAEALRRQLPGFPPRALEGANTPASSG